MIIEVRVDFVSFLLCRLVVRMVFFFLMSFLNKRDDLFIWEFCGGVFGVDEKVGRELIVVEYLFCTVLVVVCVFR